METLHATVTREALTKALDALVGHATNLIAGEPESEVPLIKLRLQVALLRAYIAECPETVELTIPNVFRP